MWEWVVIFLGLLRWGRNRWWREQQLKHAVLSCKYSRSSSHGVLLSSAHYFIRKIRVRKSIAHKVAFNTVSTLNVSNVSNEQTWGLKACHSIFTMVIFNKWKQLYSIICGVNCGQLRISVSLPESVPPHITWPQIIKYRIRALFPKPHTFYRSTWKSPIL